MYVIKQPEIIGRIYDEKLKVNREMQTILISGDSKVPNFSKVIRECFGGLFYTPSLCEEISDPVAELQWAVNAIAECKKSKQFQRMRKYTTGNALKSLLALYEFAKNLEKNLPRQSPGANIREKTQKLEALRQEGKELNEAIKNLKKQLKNEIQQQQQQQQQSGDQQQQQTGDQQSGDQGQQQPSNKQQQLEQQLRQKLQEREQKREQGIDASHDLRQTLGDNSVAVKKATNMAIAETSLQMEQIDNTIASFGWSANDNNSESGESGSVGSETGSGELEEAPGTLQEKIAVYQRVSKNTKLLQIIKEAGRFKRIVSKLKHKSYNTGEFTTRGSEYGRSLEKVFPDELMSLAHPQMAANFAKKFVNYELRQKHTVEKTRLQKGGVIIFADYSSSTLGKSNIWIGAITWAIAHTVSHEDRPVSVILFNHKVFDQDIHHFKPGEVNDAAIRIVDKSSAGGTVWENAIDIGIEYVKTNDRERSEFFKKKAKQKKSYDFILITDGENCSRDNWTKWVRDFAQFKKDYGVSLYGILVENNSSAIADIADQIISIDDLKSDEQAEQVLKIIQ